MNLYTQRRTPRAQTNVKRCWGARAVPPARRPGRVFRSKTTPITTRCEASRFPKYPTGASTYQYTMTHARLVAGYEPQLVHGGCLPPTFCRPLFSGAKRRLPTYGVCRDASPSTPPAHEPINTRRHMHNLWPDTYCSSCTVGAFPPLFGFLPRTPSLELTAPFEMLPRSTI